ncbi:hypothetical protein R6Q59_035519 [Mikania micrantha]
MPTLKDRFYSHEGTTTHDLWLSLEHAYAPHTFSREYTLKTQLLKTDMKRAQMYADQLANFGAPMAEKDLVMLVVSGLWEEYNGLKSNILTHQSPIAFSDLHGLLSFHDFMIRKLAPEVPLVILFKQSRLPLQTVL